MRHSAKQYDLLFYPKRCRAYSVSFRESGYSPAGERQDLARGMVANVAVDEARVRNDFDRVSIFQRPVFNATWDKTERRWINLTEQGEEGFSFSPTEPYREVVYRCRPFWYRVEMDGESAPSFVSVSEYPLEGYTLAPMFKNGQDFVYRPCFELALGEEGLPHSRAGLCPLKANAKRLMESVRQYDACAGTERAAEWFSDLLLLWVEFATRDLQNVMRGFTRIGLSKTSIHHNPYNNDTLYAFMLEEEDDRKCFSVGSILKVTGCLTGNLIADQVPVIDIWDLGEDTPSHFVVVDCKNVHTDRLGVDEHNDKEAVTLEVVGMMTGAALPCVKNASSGAHEYLDSGSHAIVWRGKENPWGNLSSLICDMRIARRKVDGVTTANILRLESLGDWSENRGAEWKEIAVNSPAISGSYIKSFVADPERPWYMIPGEIAQYGARYHCAYFTAGIGENLSCFYGAMHQYSGALNPSAMFFYETAMSAAVYHGGARLVLHEGGV